VAALLHCQLASHSREQVAGLGPGVLQVTAAVMGASCRSTCTHVKQHVPNLKDCCIVYNSTCKTAAPEQANMSCPSLSTSSACFLV
jgi:hypothetical protein